MDYILIDHIPDDVRTIFPYQATTKTKKDDQRHQSIINYIRTELLSEYYLIFIINIDVVRFILEAYCCYTPDDVLILPGDELYVRSTLFLVINQIIPSVNL